MAEKRSFSLIRNRSVRASAVERLLVGRGNSDSFPHMHRRLRNAAGAHAFGRRPESLGDLHSALALHAMRIMARPGFVVA